MQIMRQGAHVHWGEDYKYYQFINLNQSLPFLYTECSHYKKEKWLHILIQLFLIPLIECNIHMYGLRIILPDTSNKMH